MQITKRKSNTKKIIITSSITLLIAGLITGVFFLYFANNQPATTESSQVINLDEPTKEQIDAGAEQKSEIIENDIKSGNETPKTEDISLIVSSSEKDKTTYRFRYLIQETLNSGTCTLTMTKGSSSLVKTAQVQALASTSTCKGFDVPLSELSSGAWTATVTVESGVRSGSVSSEFQL